MKARPLKGDWIELLHNDLEKVGLTIEDEENISTLTKSSFKNHIKQQINQLSQQELELVKSDHDKVKMIVHKNLNKPQDYLTSRNFTNAQRSILFNLTKKYE